VSQAGIEFDIIMDAATRDGEVMMDGEPANTESKQQMLDMAYGAFINDAYWLFMPFKLHDPGVHLTDEGTHTDDEGKTWTEPVELPGALTGDRHTGRYTPDGRLFITFRDMTHESATKGDFVAWVGTYDDIAKGREGQYRVRLLDNKSRPGDTGYAGLELLPDGTFVTTTYCVLKTGESPLVVSVRFTMQDIDAKAASQAKKTAPQKKEER
jgi:hypothetical protein